MHVSLPFGAEALAVDIPDNWINGRCYRAFPFKPAGDERAELLAGFSEARGIDSFEKAVAGRKNAVIVLDPGFPHLFEEFVPEFLEEFEAASGLESGNILLLLAGSPWNPAAARADESVVSEGLRARYPVEAHDPFGGSDCRDAGVVMGDVPLRLNAQYLEADLKVLLGPVYPDAVNGFLGGRALLLPGLADEATLRRFYSVDRIAQPTVGYGQIRDNPLHIAGMQAVRAAGCDLVVAPLVTPDGRLSHVVVGDPGQAFLHAAQEAREKLGVSVPEPMDIVVTCGGGAPFDATMYGTLNGLLAAEAVLKKQGTIVIASEMAQGFGPRPLRELLMTGDGLEGFEARFRNGAQFLPGQWIAQRLLRLLHEHEVIVHARGIGDDELWQAGLTPAANVQDAIEVAMQGHGQRCKICALPDGPVSLAFIGDKLSHFA